MLAELALIVTCGARMAATFIMGAIIAETSPLVERTNRKGETYRAFDFPYATKERRNAWTRLVQWRNFAVHEGERVDEAALHGCLHALEEYLRAKYDSSPVVPPPPKPRGKI